MIGDFNTDRRYEPARCGDRIDMLVHAGWQHASHKKEPAIGLFEATTRSESTTRSLAGIS